MLSESNASFEPVNIPTETGSNLQNTLNIPPSIENPNISEWVNNKYKEYLNVILQLLNSEDSQINVSPRGLKVIAEIFEKLQMEVYYFDTTAAFAETLAKAEFQRQDILEYKQLFAVDIENGHVFNRQDSKLFSADDKISLIELQAQSSILHLSTTLLCDLLANLAMNKALVDWFSTYKDDVEVSIFGQSFNQVKLSFDSLKNVLPVIGGVVNTRKAQMYMVELTGACEHLLTLVTMSLYTEVNPPVSTNYIYTFTNGMESLAKATLKLENFFTDDPNAAIGLFNSANKNAIIARMQADLLKYAASLTASTQQEA